MLEVCKVAGDRYLELVMMPHVCNPSSQETETGCCKFEVRFAHVVQLPFLKFFFIFYFETGYHYVSLTVLELTT